MANFASQPRVAGARHWLGAVLALRVNDYLLRHASEYLWELRESNLVQVPVAYSATAVAAWSRSEENVGAGEAQGSGPAGSTATSSGSASVPMAPPPPKRLRTSEPLATEPLRLHSKSGTLAATSKAQGYRPGSPPRAGSSVKAMPKARPKA